MTLATPPFRKNFKGSYPDCPWERVSNLKSVALTILELFAFNAHKFRGSRDPGHAPCLKKDLRGHVWIVSGTCVSDMKSYL